MKDSFKTLKFRIRKKKAIVGVIGLGYVGLPIAVECARKGFPVYGFEVNKQKINFLMQRRKSYIVDVSSVVVKRLVTQGCFIATNNFHFLRRVDVVVICVPTPWSKTGQPDISRILEVRDTLLKYIKKSTLIILESTTYPGTTSEVFLPPFLKRGFTVGKNLFLCFSPERIDPANFKYPFPSIPKIVGGVTKKCLSLGIAFYQEVVKEVLGVSSTITAETVKLLENTFRLINIGFINEFAMLCEKLGVNVWEVIKAASTKPFGFMPFYPGPGIGGECIPADPQYLAWKARTLGFEPRMIDTASRINFSMPEYIIERIQKLLNRFGRCVKGAKILIVGVAYKKDVSDIRESPVLEVMRRLMKLKAILSYVDPYVDKITLEGKVYRSIKGIVSFAKYDLVVICTNHTIFDYRKIRETAKIIFDTRGVFTERYPSVEIL